MNRGIEELTEKGLKKCEMKCKDVKRENPRGRNRDKKQCGCRGLKRV